MSDKAFEEHVPRIHYAWEQALASGPGPAAGHTCAADPTLARGPAFAAVQA